MAGASVCVKDVGVKKQSVKVSLVFILVLVVVFTVFQPISAAEIEDNVGDEIVSEYENAFSATVSLSISSSGTASIVLNCTGKAGTTYISSTTYFKSYSNGTWKTVKINGATSASYSTSSTALSKTYTVGVGSGTYYAYTTYSVTRNGQTETFTVSSNTVSH